MNRTDALRALAHALVNQEEARIIVPSERPGRGHWFGGGNLSVGPDGALYLVGRYRNYGDSRTGLGMGERGRELAVFRSEDQGESFSKVLSFPKTRLDTAEGSVLSIEGSDLRFHDRGVTLYLSTEKDRPYPPEVAEFHKPGTGVWSIDRMDAPTVDALGDAVVKPFVASTDLETLHVKDPFVVELEGQTHVGYCTHPYTWASTNTVFGNFPRGIVWDVAVTRITCYVAVPKVGCLAGHPGSFLVFYDGAECMRQLEDHAVAVRRPRGYSCEEIGGLAVADASAPFSPKRISTHRAEFVSSWGTGSSRYVDVLFTDRWAYATWQQSQPDQSQPLVMNRISLEKVERILTLPE